ncbi:MAG: monofunctional biosynthetic peptidoglycan transglycosylase [Gemmatimonadetes bacterium]|nr:monofunctional biosynthetic peptidoglycan transglycosylase [Gemmatimonadota bacterium]
MRILRGQASSHAGRETGEPGEVVGQAPAPPRSRRLLFRLVRLLLVLFTGYYLFCVLLLLVFRFVPPPITAVQLQRRIEAVLARTEYHPQQPYRPIEAMARPVPRAVVVAEDGNFWRHGGFDLEEVRTASKEALQRGRLRGASTITQQLMKNLFGCACRSPIRKAYDLALTPAAELILGKRRILELYLNEVEWGKGIYGVDAAARQYYQVHAGRLSRTQAAGLAALLPNPRRRTIGNTPWYRSEILRRMRYRGW